MGIRSSYAQNNYGNIFRAFILAQKPRLVVECGVLDGYSAMNIAHALRFNKREKGIDSKFYAFDLWDEYEYKHGIFLDVVSLFNTNGLGKDIMLGVGDAFEVYSSFIGRNIDFLHMDISNDGDKLIKTLELWGDKISSNGVIAFEGGSEERDNGWIKKYGHKPIRPELINNPIVYENWNIQIFDPYPSLTLLFPRRKN